MSAAKLQSQLGILLDSTKLRILEAFLKRQCNWDQLEIRRDCRHAQTSHSWLWHLNSMRGTVLSQCDYVTSVRKRLGAALVRHNLNCRVCGAQLDPQGYHSDACCTGIATRGHYVVTASVLKGARLADHSAQTEVRGLTEQNLRPADILTNAAEDGAWRLISAW